MNLQINAPVILEQQMLVVSFNRLWKSNHAPRADRYYVPNKMGNLEKKGNS